MPLTPLGCALFGATSWNTNTSITLRNKLLSKENQQIVIGLRKLSLWHLCNVLEIQTKMPEIIQDENITKMEQLLELDKGNYFMT